MQLTARDLLDRLMPAEPSWPLGVVGLGTVRPMLQKDNRDSLPSMADLRRVDIQVGQRLRLARNRIGMSQDKLGRKVGLTPQQIQKYEKGTNRIGASRLVQLSEILDVDVSFFFHNVDRILKTSLSKT